MLVGRKCKVCGKTIFPTPIWAYKYVDKSFRLNYYCSWSCMKEGKYKNAKV